jgi:predicted RNase H-like nuclease (RuvC/YqgF family)
MKIIIGITSFVFVLFSIVIKNKNTEIRELSGSLNRNTSYVDKLKKENESLRTKILTSKKIINDMMDDFDIGADLAKDLSYLPEDELRELVENYIEELREALYDDDVWDKGWQENGL